jgi:hypothetical protein
MIKLGRKAAGFDLRLYTAKGYLSGDRQMSGIAFQPHQYPLQKHKSQDNL